MSESSIRASQKSEIEAPAMQPAENDTNDAAVESSCAEIQAFVLRPEFNIRRTVTEHCQFEAHAHTAFTVTALLGGRMRTCIGDQEFALTAGDVALTSIEQLHAAEAHQVDFVSVHIYPALINSLAVEMNMIRAVSEIVFRTSHTKDETILATARLIAREATAEKPGQEMMLDALVRQMAIHLLRSHLSVRKSAQIELSRAGPVDRRLRRAIEFMHDNYGRELALEEIAASAYLSEYHFARLFKQITGTTPHVYLANLRIEKARRLLVETPHSIIEIAAMVGYQSQSHFTKIFKSVTGVAPRAYRESSKR